MMLLHGFFIYAHRKGIGSDVESFASIKNLALRLVGMTLGEYDVDDYSESWLMLTYFMSYMLLMTIIMLNVLIAIVSDSYDSVMIRSKKLFLRAKFQIVADMMLMFPNDVNDLDLRNQFNKLRDGYDKGKKKDQELIEK